MKNRILPQFALNAFILSCTFLLVSCLGKINPQVAENEEYDGPDKAMEFEYDRTKDPTMDAIPRDRLIRAMYYTDSVKAMLPFQLIAGYGNWTERGPTSDVVGGSNGNTRDNSGIASGRIMALLIDAADATGNTVWTAGVDGGLWKTTDITQTSPTWTLVDDFFSNMAITGICQDPTNSNTMYFCTGEPYFNADAVAGDGIWKSTNHGVSWTQLSATTTSSFDYCAKILCDASGNIYVATRSGVFRSTDGGTSFTSITPSGLSTSRFSDMELSSTGRLHVSAGVFSTCAYRYTDNPSTVTSGTWTSPASGYPSSSVRIELGCNGTTLYALPSNASYQVPTIYKSTDGGANWAATTGSPTSGWASGQAWYALAVDVDGSGNVVVGGLDTYKSTDAGGTWTKMSDWYTGAGSTGQYVHADVHHIKMYGANRVIFCSDGGIFYSSDGGSTIRDRNNGLRIKQFYSCAIHPSTTNYFLAGAQDNGVHKFQNAGLSSTTEVTGGDGAFVAIDQDEPNYQYGSYVYNQYRRSTDGGSTWSSVNFNTNGQFINPFDFDNANNILYAGEAAGSYLRWTDPHTGSTSAVVAITALNSSSVTAVTVSPYTSNRVYFGTAGGRVVAVDNANTIASGSAGTNLSTGLPSANVSCIAVGNDDNHLLCCYSNYGVNSVWYSSNGGTSWTSLDNNGVNLPDMPIRWCMFVPGSNHTKALLATEAGVYLTLALNGTSTNWIPSSTFPTVRTDMLRYRSSDGIIAAATHGRGLWTQPLYSIVPTNKFLLKGKWQGKNGIELSWDYDGLATASSMEIESSVDGINFSKIGVVAYSGSQYTFNTSSNSNTVFYRIKSIEKASGSRYSNSIRLSRTDPYISLTLQHIYPNPVKQTLGVSFSNAAPGKVSYQITDMFGRSVWKKDENIQYTGVFSRSWNMDWLNPGTYLFTISSARERKTEKFIKK